MLLFRYQMQLKGVDIYMTDTSIGKRLNEFRKRLANERKRAKLTQEALADKLNELGYGKGQSAISEWEKKDRLPDIETIFALSKIFGCDCGYLLGDYEERTHDATAICQATGLSEETVNTLCNLRAWGAEKELTTVIDALMHDFCFAEKNADIAPLAYLISWFLHYQGGNRKSVYVGIDGTARESKDTGYVPSALKLNDRIIENAALTDIERGLISLKKRTQLKECGENGKY